jgi:hypothetical protein
MLIRINWWSSAIYMVVLLLQLYLAWLGLVVISLVLFLEACSNSLALDTLVLSLQSDFGCIHVPPTHYPGPQ